MAGPTAASAVDTGVVADIAALLTQRFGVNLQQWHAFLSSVGGDSGDTMPQCLLGLNKNGKAFIPNTSGIITRDY